MEQFNLSNYLAECVKYSPKPFDIEGIPFNLIMLDDELINNVQNRETHEEMLFAAATYGLSAGSERATNCSELKERMKVIWEMEELSVDCKPSLRHKVGIVVCELSGLTDFINAQKAKEDAEAEVALNLAIEKEEEAKVSAILSGITDKKITMHTAINLSKRSPSEVSAILKDLSANATGRGKTKEPKADASGSKADQWNALKAKGDHRGAQKLYTKYSNEISSEMNEDK